MTHDAVLSRRFQRSQNVHHMFQASNTSIKVTQSAFVNKLVDLGAVEKIVPRTKAHDRLYNILQFPKRFSRRRAHGYRRGSFSGLSTNNTE